MCKSKTGASECQDLHQYLISVSAPSGKGDVDSPASSCPGKSREVSASFPAWAQLPGSGPGATCERIATWPCRVLVHIHADDGLSVQAQDVTLRSSERKGNVCSICNPLLARNVRVAVITSWAGRPRSRWLSVWIPATQSWCLLVPLYKEYLLSTHHVGLVWRLNNYMVALNTEARI